MYPLKFYSSYFYPQSPSGIALLSKTRCLVNFLDRISMSLCGENSGMAEKSHNYMGYGKLC